MSLGWGDMAGHLEGVQFLGMDRVAHQWLNWGNHSHYLEDGIGKELNLKFCE